MFGIGTVVAEGIVRFFADEHTARHAAPRCIDAGVSAEAPAPGASVEPARGAAERQDAGRDRHAARLQPAGGGGGDPRRRRARRRHRSRRRPTYLVAGDKAGSKLAKAEKLGVPVLDEEAFRKVLEGQT